MHELALSENLVNTSLQHADGLNVAVIDLKVGLLSCVDPQALNNCFDAIKNEYPQLLNTKLHVQLCLPLATCKDCSAKFELKKIGEPCGCGSFNYTLEGGEELTIASLHFEEQNLAG